MPSHGARRGKSKLSPSAVAFIERGELDAASCAERFGISVAHVWAVRRAARSRAGGAVADTRFA